MKKIKAFDLLTQVALPSLTVGAQVATALKFPEWGLIVNFIAQPFWLYSSWKSFKQAGQAGIFINTVIFSIVTFLGIVNYWLL